MDSRLETVNFARLFYVFLLVHVLVWTIVPFTVRYTLPMDAIEGAIWGQQFEFGYDKNPYLNGWLTGLALLLGGKSGWLVYLFSQLSVALCFWSIWQLAKAMLSPLHAFLSVLVLEGIQYYNLHAIDFNDNTLELGLWGLSILFFYRATKSGIKIEWIFCGIFVGLSMMTKYYAIMLMAAMFLFLISSCEQRWHFKKNGIYLALAAFVIVVLPHVIWLFYHNFVTLDYAVQRVSARKSNWHNHFYYSWHFALEQLQVLLPAVVLTIPLLSRNRIGNFSLSEFDKRFLLYLGLGPFVLTILLSVFSAITLRAAWGEPLLSLVGILIFAFLQPEISLARLRGFLVIFYCLLAITVTGYGLALTKAAEPSSANFPGKNIAKYFTNEWHQTFHLPLHYVVGTRWIAGNIAVYSKDKPRVLLDWNTKYSPWIDELKLRQAGAVFVWETSEEDPQKLAEIFSHYPTLSQVKTVKFTWLRNKKMEPVEVGFAYLPPQI